MITLQQYFQAKPHSVADEDRARDLLERVEQLCDRLGHIPPTDPDTGSQISGSKGGAGDGGFRLPNSSTGRQSSSHKEARGVDVYDPKGELDDALTDEQLEEFGLYREAPNSTPGWCHLTTRPPLSGRRTFNP